METLTITYMPIWLALWVIFALFLLLKNSFKIRDDLGGFPLHELTVVIPFRNEKTNLKLLLEAILSQQKHPALYIFVDDHSDDGGADFIEEQLKNTAFKFELRALKGEKSGKKHAIMEAALIAKTQYIQTLDADIWFDENFFANLPEPKDLEMLILQVRMVGHDRFTKVLELEYASFQLLQALAPRNKPLMASGANLIVHRETYLDTNDLSKHAHRSSGDDQYALVQFIQKNKKINTYFDSNLAVFTKTPESVNLLLNQRIRWMGNNTQGNDHRALLIALFIFGVNLSFLWFVIHGLFFGFSGSDLSVVLLKFFTDFIMYFAWFKRNSTWQLAPYLPILSVLYPLYLIALLSRYLMQKKQFWKNRPV